MRLRTKIKLFLIFCLCISIFPSNLQAFARPAAIFNPANIEFQLTASGLTQPLLITNAGDGSGRLFIIERAGRIRIFKNGSLLSTPFLDIRSIVNSTGSEQGLLALAFHPNYPTNGQFFTVYTDTNGSLILSRFTRSSANPDLADLNSRTTLLAVSHPTFQNHNGGTLAFGPDGYLYWSTGDGGSGGDPANNAQNLGSLLGKILRLNIDSGSPYSIPASNPFFNNSNPSIRKEIWAYGLRNPWRFSFDRQTGDLYIGDVGQSAREEIDFQPANDAGGNNYGWRLMEGTSCYDPPSGCDPGGKVLPIAEYDHSMGCSVTGGHIYRGQRHLAMQGQYFYGDFCTGVLFTLHNNPASGWTVTQIADTPYSISSFGEDEAGELYLADFVGGKIYQIQYNADLLVPGNVTGLTATTGTTNGSVDLSWIAPSDDAGNSQSGPVTSYLVKYSTAAIATEADWNNANLVSRNLPAPVAPGNAQTMTVTGLDPETRYYFAVRAQDEEANQSERIATASARTKVLVAVPIGLYDDMDPAWSYSGDWATYSGSEPYKNTLHYTSTAGDAAYFLFTGTKFTFTFTKDLNRGSIDVYVDGNKVTTINAYSAFLVFQQTYTSPSYPSGDHLVRLVHAGNGAYIDIDAIQTFGVPVVVSAGTYDNVNPAWAYSGGWATYNGSGPYNGTLHYTNTVGDAAELTFTGTQFTLLFTKDFNRGLMDVYVDGNKIATVDAYSASLVFQQTYTSPSYPNGNHTVRLVHAGKGAYIDIDAIQIYGTPLAVAAGTYDDTDPAWAYSGTWATTALWSQAYNSSLHYTSTVGDAAELIFTGTKFTLIFTKDINRGLLDVYVDGNKLTTLDVYSPSLIFQQSYTSPTLTNGNHTVRLVHAGGRPYMDIDAITILP